MIANITVSLKAAELASETVALLSLMQANFPELRPPMGLGLGLLDASWGLVSGKPPTPRTAPVAPKPEPELPIEDVWDPASQRDVSRCKALLLEVLRRAAHDWVLYRQHHKLLLRELAEDAYTWLFMEEPGHPYWKQRAIFEFELESGPVRGVRSITSFLAICEALSLDPETVRAHVRKLDVRTIIASGRPAETRKLQPVDAVSVEECNLSVDIDVDSMHSDRDFVSEYESLGTVNTPRSLYSDEYSDTY